MTTATEPVTVDPETGQPIALSIPCTLGSLSIQKTKESVGITVVLEDPMVAIHVLLGAQLEVKLTKGDPAQGEMFDNATPALEAIAECHSISVKPAGGQSATLSFTVGAVDHAALLALANGDAHLVAKRVGKAGAKTEDDGGSE